MANLSEKEKIQAYLKSIVLSMPEKPGCYQYFDENGVIIYVGKAKNLKRRVYSYFSKEHDNRKTAILVSKIRDIKYTVVNTEEDALLLENNLIKEWNPRYNILLKDGKTYPSIVVTNEFLPRIFQTRKINKKFGSNHVLKDIDLHVKAGEMIGIIGGTGSAKSSLMNLIPRLYDVSEGSVKVGGVDVRQYDLASLRDQVSMVLQQNNLFSGTILHRGGVPQGLPYGSGG